MITYSTAMRQFMETLDVHGLMRAWSQVFPHLPKPHSVGAAMVSLHMARTAAVSIETQKRQFSHRWLLDRGFPSQLPEELKPNAEQDMSPRIVDAVGLSVNSKYGEEVIGKISHAMRDAILDAYADGKRDPQFVRQRMQAARFKERKALGL